MNAAQVLDHFDRICDAPDAIPRLRRFILDLAVRGKLVEQDPNDEPASELLKRIQAEKARLVKEGRFRVEKPLSPIDQEETDFATPQSWTWIRLGQIVKLWSGYAFKSSDFQAEGVPVIRIGDLKNGEVVADSAVRVSHKVAAEVGPEVWIPPDALLIAMSGATTGKVAFNHTGTRLLLNQRVGRIEVFQLSVDFIGFFFETIIARNLSISFGTAIPNLSAQQINETAFPLPPLAEQHRIVAKVDELMALCDRLEAAEAERESRRNKLVAGTLHRLNNGANADEFREHARFHLRHLPRLTMRPEHIQQLRQAILNLAVRGKLVPQDPNDEPASELLKRIQADKHRLAKEGTNPQKRLFACPESWELVSFGNICNQVTSGSRGWAEFCSNTGPKFIRAQNIRFGRLLVDNLACVNPPNKSEGKRTRVSKGDLLIVITGAGVTNPALVDHDLGEAYVSQHVALIKPAEKGVCRWLLLCLMAPAGGRSELVERAYGAGKPGLNLDNIRSLTVPVPPLAEQHRIVAKVDQLMAVCDRLETQLTSIQTENRRLLEAVLHDALNGST